MYAVLFGLFSIVILIFIPLRLKIEVFFDILDGRFIFTVGLPLKIKKVILRGAYGEDGFAVFLFNKKRIKADGKKPKGKKKRGNRRRVKRINIPLAVRRLKLKNLYLDVLFGGEDFTASLFTGMFVSNLINCYGRAVESAFEIDGFFAKVITAEKTCLKIRINAYFDLFIYKILRIFLAKG
jgi:hypothetical protein